MEITVVQGDITKIKADAIINAANSSLLGGGGVDGAIHRAGGPEILEACRAIRNRQGKCATGEAVITTAGKLDAKYVIHTVGPVWNGGKLNEVEKLKQCYQNCMILAAQNQCQTVAFPGISTGIYRFPKQAAAQIAIDTVKSFVSEVIKEVIFVAFDKENYEVYKELL